MKDFIRKLALQNAVRYKGTGNAKALVGAVIKEYPEQKKDMGSLMKLLSQIMDEVNSLSLDEQESQLESLGGATKKEHKIGLKELDNAKPGNVIMRFAPSPSGPMHIGHALTGGITSLYVKKYGGKFILRIEDTNSDNIEPRAYDWLKRDADYLFGNVDEVVIQSERMEIYYKYARQLISQGYMYVCDLPSEEFRETTAKGIESDSRKLSSDENLKRFDKMFDSNGYQQGDVVVRWKSDLGHPNPAMRDFPLFRINESEHPRQGKKYRVWPLMNFSVAIDDIELGMTHIIRGKDHADNAKRQELIYKALGKQIPHTYFTGRYKFTDMDLSASKTKELITLGQFTGWDDIRLPFIEPLRLRGYSAESFLKMTQLVGLTKVDKTTTKEDFFKALDSYNKDAIDMKTPRRFFIEDPVKMNIGINKNISLDLFPDKKGGRELKVSKEIYIEKIDTIRLARGTIRLIDLANILNDTVVSETYDEYKSVEQKAGIIHWLPIEQNEKVTIVMPDGREIQGIAEPAPYKEGDIVQFERFGFCRYNANNTFWYGHK